MSVGFTRGLVFLFYQYLLAGGWWIQIIVEISVIMTNFALSDVNVKIGDHIAQIMFLKTEEVYFVGVAELGRTAQGAGGFGSTN